MSFELLPEILHSLLAFIVIISVIVFVHEFGHYWVARRCGVRVETFSIGFGKELFGWNDKHGTRWKVALFPLGGYVKMFGDMGAASTPDGAKLKKMSAKDKREAFHFKTLPQKAAVVAAGPASNFIFAFILLTGFFIAYGKPETAPIVGEVVKGSAAEAAKLEKGDVILYLNKKKIERFEDLRAIASENAGQVMPITYQRGQNRIVDGFITPKLAETTDIFGNKVKVGQIGISSSSIQYKDVPFWQAIPLGAKEVYTISANTLKAVGQMLTGRRSADELSGVLRIGKYSGQAAEKGISVVLWFMAVLSVNLGLINLFPIPVLDGGHLVFYAVEGLKGRPLAERVQEWCYRVGFTLLILLMVFATYNDLRSLNIF